MGHPVRDRRRPTQTPPRSDGPRRLRRRPRTLGQRRADALGALAADGKHLACTCHNPDCPHRERTDARATSVVIHVVADHTSLAADPDPLHHGELPPLTPDFGPAPDPEPEPVTGHNPAYLEGGYTLPAPLLAELLAAGATQTPLDSLAHTTPEPRYRPSAALQRFIRSRDLTCRFPGCDAPAWTTDIDHTIAYPWGPTHPADLKCLCRKHHLLKTFWTGPHGWRDRQHPDGTITWTAPTGHTYTTQPGSRLLFPTLCQPTEPPPATPTPPPAAPQRTLMMPLRRRTRTQDRTYRIHTQRTLNQQAIAATKHTRKQPISPPPPPDNDDPPPF
nr:HNH endonuclease signature motif containing protein [Mycobacterium asiaticum]